ncbi:uncharacterized protein [Lepisosteus oculatus]|uniref:uncharacterized protein n=1 Tax=Lepisosteus oculatus TaxID=7918 RepID=UPI0035F52602
MHIILDLSVRFEGSLFYDYHKQFSAKAAACLLQWNQRTYWGALDIELYCCTFAGIRLLRRSSRSAPAGLSMLAPPSAFPNDYWLFCLPQSISPLLLPSCSVTPTPLPATSYSTAFPSDSHQACAHFLLPPSFCKKLQSATADPQSVDSLLASEVENGFMIGPLDSPPFPAYRINPIGIAVRKYSCKKRLIIDLSAPHNSHVPSLNSLIPSSDFSLHYATIDHAISLIKIAGPGAWLAKAEISSAFKVMPLDPDFWHLFGVHWRNKFFFAVHLTFRCRSRTKIFDTLAEALCWILLNNYRLPFLVHLLDDFLTVDFPHASPARASSTLTSVFGKLGVPLATDKTTGPSHIIQFLGITLNSINFSASLPREKIDRIQTYISTYSSAKSCTKRELLSLLSHHNYAMCIIPQGRSFISYLLELSI